MLEIAKPSRTALGVAVRRAAHQVYDSHPLVLDDPIAVPILGERYRPAVEDAAKSIYERPSVSLRAWVVVRNRLAEDNLALAVHYGVRQYVLLGAGLDTFAYRNPHPGLQVFEVDHPATQEWKRELALTNGLPEPSCLHYVPLDFEHQDLAQQLAIFGLDFAAPTVFAWLGVVLYLTHQSFRTTLDLIASFPEGSGVIFDYALPRQALAPHELKARDALSARVQSIGELFQLFFTPEEIKTELAQFKRVEDLDARELNARYLVNRTDRLNLVGRSANIVSAWR